MSHLGRGAMLLAIVLPALARAQPSATPRAPDYLPSRFDERWPAPNGRAQGFDALKHIALLGRDRAYLTIGGQWRYRAESVHHYLLGSGADRDDTFGLDRVLLSGDLHVGNAFRAFVEGRDAQAIGRTLPGGARPVDRDRWDVQNAFAEGTWARRATAVHLRVGRQEISLGRERLVGLSDWANARRTFEGARAMVNVRAVKVDAFLTRPVNNDQTHRDRRDSTTTFWGTTLGRSLPRGTWQLYALDLHQKRATLAGATGPRDRLTVGGRVSGTALPPWLAYDLESAMQRGHSAGRDIGAAFVASEITATARHAAWTPSVGVGYDVSSGDRDSTDRSLGTFSPLYPTSHAHGGFADVIGRQNSAEARAFMTVVPHRGAQLRAGVHRFERTRLTDAAYTKASTILQPGTASSARHVGSEIDLTGQTAVGRHVKLFAGYGHFAPGPFLRVAPLRGHALDWGYGSVTFTF